MINKYQILLKTNQRFQQVVTFSSQPMTDGNKKLNRIGAAFPIKPGYVSPMRSVPSTVIHPNYSKTGIPDPSPEEIFLYSADHIVKLRKAARLARKMLDFALSKAKAGISTEEIDILAHAEIVKHGAYPSPINFYGFPKAICTSVNEVVCHGIPDDRKLEKGDILSIDVSLYLDGCHGDNCGTVIVDGPIEGDENAVKLLETTHEALNNAIAICKPGACISEIGKIIEATANDKGFEVIHEFCGHGTGPILHMQPLIYHFKNNERLTMDEGMLFTIEPILVEGSRKITIWNDKWSAVTVDKGRGAQVEHEVLITSTGAEVLTIPE